MATVTLYISRLFLGSLAAVLLGFVALLQTFDLLKNADDVMARHGESALTLLKYGALRVPETAGFILPICVLIAALLCLARLAQNNEIIALKASGLPVWRILLAFGPSAVAVAAAQFVLSDQAVPIAKQTLDRWDAASMADDATEGDGDGHIWLHEAGTVIRIAAVGDDGTALQDVTLYLRDPVGNLTETLHGEEALYQAGGWRLVGTKRTTWRDGQAPKETLAAEVPWQIELTPEELSDLATRPSALTLGQLMNFAARPGLGEYPSHSYESWLHKRIAMPFAVLLMVLLAAPMARTLDRTGSVLGNFCLGLGFGVIYLIAEGVVFTLGEAGSFPPVLAAWVPIFLFACLGGLALVYIET